MRLSKRAGRAWRACGNHLMNTDAAGWQDSSGAVAMRDIDVARRAAVLILCPVPAWHIGRVGVSKCVRGKEGWYSE